MEGAPKIRFFECCKKAISDFKDYNGRSRRCEFWFWILGVDICTLILCLLLLILIKIPVLDNIGYIIAILYSGAVFAITLPLSIRRLHDIGKSGWFILIGVIPIVGTIILFILFCFDSQRQVNQYGQSPKYYVSTPSSITSYQEII